jgi:hypothetical protein
MTHFRQNHSDNEITCPSCKNIVELFNLEQHLMTHTKHELVISLMMRLKTRAKSKS